METKEKPQYTIQDVLKHRGGALVKWRLLPGEDSMKRQKQRWLEMLQHRDWYRRMTEANFGWLATSFRPFLPEIKTQDMRRIYLEYRAERIRRRKRHAGVGSTGRIYPLTAKQYHDFAVMVWEKRGSPRFSKRKITGVKFGRPLTTRKGGYMSGPLEQRWIGCELITDHEHWAFKKGEEPNVPCLMLWIAA